MRQGQPRKALLHSESVRKRGQESGNQLMPLFAALLRGQALADLNDDENALNHFSTWTIRWKKSNMIHLVVTAFLESAAIHIRSGNIEQAEKFLNKARKILPKDEPLFVLHRNKDFVTQIIADIQIPKKVSTISPASTVMVEIQTLGQLSLEIHGLPIYDRLWKGQRSKQLLKAIISLGGSKVPLEKLSYILWPDSDGDRGMNNLKTALSRLRKIGSEKHTTIPGWLKVKHQCVSLVHLICRVDALEFYSGIRKPAILKSPQSLQHTLKLYSDDFLPNDNEPWIETFRVELQKLFTEGVLLLVSTKGGNKEKNLNLLQQACLIDPLHEGLHACLMQNYLHTGYPAYALKVFKKVEQFICEQTGGYPGPALCSLALLAKQDRRNH